MFDFDPNSFLGGVIVGLVIAWVVFYLMVYRPTVCDYKKHCDDLIEKLIKRGF